MESIPQLKKKKRTGNYTKNSPRLSLPLKNPSSSLASPFLRFPCQLSPNFLSAMEKRELPKRTKKRNRLLPNSTLLPPTFTPTSPGINGFLPTLHFWTKGLPAISQLVARCALGVLGREGFLAM